MSATDPSPFTEPKTNRLVWIVPSIVLHAVILVVWLSLPPEPPRQPGERKLSINRSQAELLQQHVEDANLVMLHSKVSELQAIKQAMATLRENQMDQLRVFEQEMAVTAPQDAAGLFTQLIAAQQALIASYQGLVETVTRLNTETPHAEMLMKKGQPAEALAVLQGLKPLRDQVGTLLDVLHEQTSISFALVSTGEVKLEWIADPVIAVELAALKSSMEEALATKNLAVQEINAAFGQAPGRAFNALMTDPEENKHTLENFPRMVEEGVAAIEKERLALQEIIRDAEQESQRLEQAIVDAREKLQAVENNAGARARRNTLNAEVKGLQNTQARLEGQLRNDRNRMGRLRFSPDRNLAGKANSLNSHLNSVFVPLPDPARISEAMHTQLQVTRASRALLERLVGEVSP